MQGDSDLMCLVPGIQGSFSSLGRTRLRKAFWQMFAAALVILFLAPLCRAQITNVTDETSTPTPGSGHNYYKMLNETVNPANGSVSLSISVPVPEGRGLTLPFSFDYNSDAAQVLQARDGGADFVSNQGPVSDGGWSYSVPLLSFGQVEQPVSYQGKEEYCTWNSEFVYQDPSGNAHPLNLASRVPNNQYPSLCSADNITPGGDDFVEAAFTSCTTNCSAVAVADADGTTSQFASYADYGVPAGNPVLARTVEDRNGNTITINWSGSGGAFSYTDELGRTALSSSGFGTASGQSYTVSVSGLSNPYTIYWGSVSPDYQVGTSDVGPATTGCSGVGGMNMTVPVITEIELPNGQAYHFYYNSSYGLLDEVVYPSGGWIKYTWAIDHSSELAFLPAATGSGNGEGCYFVHGWPRLTERQISFNGSTVAQTQTFTYSTTWDSPQYDGWSSKSTNVATTDDVTGTSQNTTYTYTWILSGNNQPAPAQYSLFGGEMPEEQQVVYSSGSTALRTETKGWYDPYELACQLDTQDGSGLSGVFYTYGPGAQVTDKKEYDYGAISSTSECPSKPQNPIIAPSGPTRETQITYASFSATSIFPAEPSILDRPSTIVISGTNSAETDYSYDSKGNALTKTRKCLNGCSGGSGNAVTHYTYDGNGQVTEMTSPDGNPTGYQYTCSDTYLSKITDPLNHPVSFGYNCASGELTSSTDQNNQTTNYAYSDPLNRLTSITYPDGGETKYTYNDSAPNPTVTTCKLLSSGTWANCSTTTMDGAGQVIKMVGENGAETDMTYNGEGQLHTKSNPYFSTSDPTYGITTYKHDILGRITSTGYPDGNSSIVTYTGTSKSDCSTTDDPAGKTNESCTDALGRIISDTDGLGNTTDYTYDALDNLTSVTEGSQTRTFGYNSLSELYSETNPESGMTTFTYDGDGNVMTRTRPSANQTNPSVTTTTTYAYNADDQLLSKTYSDGTPTVTFSYGQSSVTLNSNWTSPTLQYAVGRLTEATTTASGSLQTALVYSYGPMGRVKDLWQCMAPYNCGGLPFGMTYDYDLAGDVTSYSGPDWFTVTYGINNAQQQTSMTWGSNVAVSSITYNPAGEISTMCGGDGCSDSEETRVYNDRLQPVLMELGSSTSPSADYCLVYNYYTSLGSPSSCAVPAQGTGDNGDVIGKYYQDSVNTGYSHTSTFTYDAVNRLTSAVAAGNSSYNLTYSYDEYGNGTCVMNGSTEGLCPQYSYNEVTNQISNTGYSYDAAGNLLNDGTYSYTYDANGRVVSDTSATGWQYPMYNALGQRVQDHQSAGSNDSTYLMYPQDTFGRRTEIFEYHPSVGWVGADIWFAQVAGQRIKMGGSTSWLLHSDALGSSTMETDQTGAVDWDGNFYPYGQPWHAGNGEVSFAGLGYPVNEPVLPSATRGYDPGLGRWLTPDPAGMAAAIPSNPQTWNMYSYALDNPTSLNDPSGEKYCATEGAQHQITATCVSNKAYEKDPGKYRGYVYVITVQDISVELKGSDLANLDLDELRLIAAQDTAMQNPYWKAYYGGKTWCNVACSYVVTRVGAPSVPFLRPNGTAYRALTIEINIMKPLSGWIRVPTATQAQALANEGKIVVAFIPWTINHVVSLRPGGVPGDVIWHLSSSRSPWAANVGAHNGVMGMNWAFDKTEVNDIRYYTPGP